MTRAVPSPGSTTEAELRSAHRAIVEKYLSTTEADRRNRYLLFTENGTAALFFTDVGRPIVVRGRERLREHGELSLKVLPDWRWHDVTIFETQDPNRFWVECTGSGRILFPGYPPGVYRNHFVHSFEFADGGIVAAREFTNPIEHMRALSIDTPRIARDWIPAEPGGVR
ncbi:MAG TPA: PhzA/PhzB family protein [Thermomonospora sp.]|nr:PhzA/PhzB family protein [Thermomonospora sp.]